MLTKLPRPPAYNNEQQNQNTTGTTCSERLNTKLSDKISHTACSWSLAHSKRDTPSFIVENGTQLKFHDFRALPLLHAVPRGRVHADDIIEKSQ